MKQTGIGLSALLFLTACVTAPESKLAAAQPVCFLFCVIRSANTQDVATDTFNETLQGGNVGGAAPPK